MTKKCPKCGSFNSNIESLPVLNIWEIRQFKNAERIRDPQCLQRCQIAIQTNINLQTQQCSASTCASTPKTVPRRSGWPPGSSGAGPVARRWHWLQTRTILNLVSTQAQQRFHVQRRSAWPQVPVWRTRTTDEPSRLIIGAVRLHHMIRRGTNYGQAAAAGSPISTLEPGALTNGCAYLHR